MRLIPLSFHVFQPHLLRGCWPSKPGHSTVPGAHQRGCSCTHRHPHLGAGDSVLAAPRARMRLRDNQPFQASLL